MEATLEEIIDAIEKKDDALLEEYLKNGNTHLDEYFEVEDMVLMTPLLFSVKMKSPDCVEVLVLCGANIKASLKMWDPDYPEDETKQKSLHTSALRYATGEKDKATEKEDIILYDDIIAILKEAKKAYKKASKKLPVVQPQAEDTPPQTLQTPQPSLTLSTVDPESFLSPSSVAESHRIAQKTIQNQLDIKKLFEENESLKSEIEELKKELKRLKPWVEKWIFEGGPVSTPILRTKIAEEEDSSKSTERKKSEGKERHRSAYVKTKPETPKNEKRPSKTKLLTSDSGGPRTPKKEESSPPKPRMHSERKTKEKSIKSPRREKEDTKDKEKDKDKEKEKDKDKEKDKEHDKEKSIKSPRLKSPRPKE